MTVATLAVVTVKVVTVTVVTVIVVTVIVVIVIVVTVAVVKSDGTDTMKGNYRNGYWCHHCSDGIMNSGGKIKKLN